MAGPSQYHDIAKPDEGKDPWTSDYYEFVDAVDEELKQSGTFDERPDSAPARSVYIVTDRDRPRHDGKVFIYDGDTNSWVLMNRQVGHLTSKSVRTVNAGATATDIQREIDDLHARVAEGAHGVVYGPDDDEILLDQTVRLPSNVYLENFALKVADGANCTAVATSNFEEKTGSDEIAASDGVQYNQGLINVVIDGNKQNNTGTTVSSVDGIDIGGVAIFGRWNYMRNVYVRDCSGVGYYTECGTGLGVSDWRDLHEGKINTLWSKDNRRHGIVHRGPHDAQMSQIISAGNSGAGILTQKDSSKGYTGVGVEVDFLHFFSNDEDSHLTNGRYAFISPDGDTVHVDDGGMKIGTISTIADGAIVFHGRTIVGAIDGTYEIASEASDVHIGSALRNPDADQGSRTVINGVGENNGDPRRTGQWNGRAIEGVSVIDVTDGTEYVRRSGSWYPTSRPPQYQTVSDVPSLGSGEFVWVEDEGRYYYEDGK